MKILENKNCIHNYIINMYSVSVPYSRSAVENKIRRQIDYQLTDLLDFGRVEF